MILFMGKAPILFKDVHGDAGLTCLVDKLNLKCDKASTKGRSPLLYGRTYMDGWLDNAPLHHRGSTG